MAAPWENIVIREFGDYAWLLTDINREKYKDTFDILQRAIEQKWYESDTGLQRFQAAIAGSSFFKEIEDKKIRQQIINTIGGQAVNRMNPRNLGKLIGEIVNYGYDGEDLQRAVYKEVLKRNEQGGYANPEAAAFIRNSTVYKQYEMIGKAYFSKVPTRQIDRALMGQITADEISAAQRELAKTKYSHLASVLDKGQTLEDIAANYRAQAAQLLEVDESTIDMGASDFEKAYAFGEAGNQRMMTAGEWSALLRTDSRYNWNKTMNAKNEARALGQSLAMAFGRLR
jgi:hypothetical protein